MTRARPLRFLALVLGLWIGGRVFMLAIPGPPSPGEPDSGAAPVAARSSPARPRLTARSPEPVPVLCCLIRDVSYKTGVARPSAGAALAPAPPFAPFVSMPANAVPSAFAGERPYPPASPQPEARQAAPWGGAPPASRSRWFGSAWLLARDGRGRAVLAPGGTLGGSQAGARLLYRVGTGVSLSGRGYLPLRRTAEAEIAAGIDWQPSARLPIHVLAERRQDIGGAGRSAFALTVYGGVSGGLPAGLRGEAYGQAGIVGTRSRDLVVDATARVSLPVGRVEVGGSAWGAAQPGAARLDAGPHVAYRLPVEGANLRIQADWRFRIAGDAAPGSGPALTVGLDF